VFTESTPICRLFRHHPAAMRSVLSWYGIRVGDEASEESLVVLCDRHGVDVDDLLVDLGAQIDDD